MSFVRKKKSKDDVKVSEFDALLKSGETIIMSLSPFDRTPVRMRSESAGGHGTMGRELDDILDRIDSSSDNYSDQRVEMRPRHRRNASTSAAMPATQTESSTAPAPAAKSDDDTTEGYLRRENQRLELRIKELNDDLFKEREANSALTAQIRDLLQTVEALQQNMSSGPTNAVSLAEAMTSQASGSPAAHPSPPMSSSPSPGPERAHAGDDEMTKAKLAALDEQWRGRYKSVEDRCNALSVRAVQTIQECKLRMTQQQKEILELQDRLRESETVLQQREIEKGRAMMVIPRLVEMVKKYEMEAQAERQKRQLDKEFDNLRLQATIRSSSSGQLGSLPRRPSTIAEEHRSALTAPRPSSQAAAPP